MKWTAVNIDDVTEKIATISKDGVVTANLPGKVLFAAELASDSTITAEAKIQFRKLLSHIVMNRSNESDKKGIAQTSVYGTKDYKDGKLKAAEMLFKTVFPLNVDPSELNYSCDSIYAAFDPSRPNVLVFNGTAFEGVQTVNVTVSAKYPKYEHLNVTKTYTFKIVNGVNVYDEAGIMFAVSERLDMCVQNNIKFTKEENRFLRSSIYGNGYIIENEKKPSAHSRTSFTIRTDLAISNLILRADKVNSNTEINSELLGYILKIEHEEMWPKVRIEYSIIENGNMGIVMEAGHLEVSGCIVRNTVSFGISESVRQHKYSDVEEQRLTVENSVFSNSIAPSIAVVNFYNDKPENAKGYVTVKGFCDIYNWQPLVNLGVILEGQISQSLIDIVMNSISSDLEKDPKFAPYSIMIDGVLYAHLGIIGMGAIKPTPAVWDVQAEGYSYFVFELFRGLLLPMDIYLYENTSSIQPGDFYKENADLYGRLRGEAEAEQSA